MAGWWRGLVRLAPALAMAVFALAARAADSSDPKTWDPETWTVQRLLDDGLSEMRFVIVRSNAAGCEPNCPEWISAEGAIEAGTPAKLKRLLKGLGPRRLPIIVNSPGGNVDAALQLGRIIRKNKLDIAVGKTSFSQCQSGSVNCPADAGKGVAQLGMASDGGAMCNSACPLMLAGGAQRLVGRWAYLGVHQITTTFQRQQIYYRTMYRMVHGRKKIISSKVISRTNVGTYQTYEMSKAVERKLSGYLKEMGVGQGVVDLMKVTPAGDIHQLSLEEMTTMNLVTSQGTVDLLTSAMICSSTPRASNCRELRIAQAKAINPTAALTDAALHSPVARSAKADNSWEMQFVLVRSGDPKCGFDCPEWISAQGTITHETQEIFRQLLDTVGSRRLPLIVNSPGGDLLSALAMGRLIRDRKLEVVVARTDFTGCKPRDKGCMPSEGFYSGVTVDSGARCDAACPIVLAGGVRRFVDSNASVSVQSLAFAERIRSYLSDMSVGQNLYPPPQANRFDYGGDRLQLEPDTRLKLHLTTGAQSADALSGATVCNQSPKPENCRVKPSADAVGASN